MTTKIRTTDRNPGSAARGWVRTDPGSCRDDVARLGLVQAARYNARLARERVRDGDSRWYGITVAAMRAALEEETR